MPEKSLQSLIHVYLQFAAKHWQQGGLAGKLPAIRCVAMPRQDAQASDKGALLVADWPNWPALTGRIAQVVEQLTLNQRVVGSSPTAPTKEIREIIDLA